MSDRVRVSLEFLGVLLVALLFTVAPGGGSTLNVILAILSIAFFVAIALLGYRLYRENRFTLEGLTDLQRGVLYSAVGGAFLVVRGIRAAVRHGRRRGRDLDRAARPVLVRRVLGLDELARLRVS